MHVNSETHLDGDVLVREVTTGDAEGILWTPEHPTDPVPLVLLGHPGGLERMHPRLAARALREAHAGFASLTLELPGSGSRHRLPAVEGARGELRDAIRRGEAVPARVIDDLVLPLVDLAVPEWRAAIDALLERGDIDGPVGVSGGLTAIGIRMGVIEPRLAALTLFAGSFVPRSILEEARRVRVPTTKAHAVNVHQRPCREKAGVSRPQRRRRAPAAPTSAGQGHFPRGRPSDHERRPLFFRDREERQRDPVFPTGSL